jgi:Ca2+-binding EF-hand superfamily protein
MKRTSLALFATVIISAFSAAAQDNAQPATEGKGRRDPAKMFARIDQNSDSKISLDEFLAMRNRRGQNQQDQKDPQDQKAAQSERRTAMFKKLDANADGFVTSDEFKSFSGRRGEKREKGAQQR